MSIQSQTELDDLEMALFLQREKHRLSQAERKFVNAMVGALMRPAITLAQQQRLHRLFLKLREKTA